MGETQFLCQGNGACVLIMSDSATPRTAVCQVPLCMGFSGREHCSGLPSPPPGDLPDPGPEPPSPTLQMDSLPLCHLGSQGKGQQLKR